MNFSKYQKSYSGNKILYNTSPQRVIMQVRSKHIFFQAHKIKVKVLCIMKFCGAFPLIKINKNVLIYCIESETYREKKSYVGKCKRKPKMYIRKLMVMGNLVVFKEISVFDL